MKRISLIIGLMLLCESFNVNAQWPFGWKFPESNEDRAKVGLIATGAALVAGLVGRQTLKRIRHARITTQRNTQHNKEVLELAEAFLKEKEGIAAQEPKGEPRTDTLDARWENNQCGLDRNLQAPLEESRRLLRNHKPRALTLAEQQQLAQKYHEECRAAWRLEKERENDFLLLPNYNIGPLDKDCSHLPPPQDPDELKAIKQERMRAIKYHKARADAWEKICADARQEGEKNPPLVLPYYFGNKSYLRITLK